MTNTEISLNPGDTLRLAVSAGSLQCVVAYVDIGANQSVMPGRVLNTVTSVDGAIVCSGPEAGLYLRRLIKRVHVANNDDEDAVNATLSILPAGGETAFVLMRREVGAETVEIL